jgi:hypothetical protein
MSFHPDPVAVIVLPPNVSSDNFEVIMSDEFKAHSIYGDVLRLRGLKVSKIIEKKQSENHLIHAIIVETEEYIDEARCPDCNGHLDENDECPGWYEDY